MTVQLPLGRNDAERWAVLAWLLFIACADEYLGHVPPLWVLIPSWGLVWWASEWSERHAARRA